MTRDGSPTLVSSQWGCAFHSRHGALTEALHVYIQEGLAQAATMHSGPLHVLEMGAGTGFNAALAAAWAHAHQRNLFYTGLDVALPEDESWDAWRAGWPERPKWMDFAEGMRRAWKAGEIYDDGRVRASYRPGRAGEIALPGGNDCVFYDAFSPTQQPELWTPEALAPWLASLGPTGSLVTYCARGHVFRAVRGLGYRVEHVQGPPGKREMLRAYVVSQR